MKLGEQNDDPNIHLIGNGRVKGLDFPPYCLLPPPDVETQHFWKITRLEEVGLASFR